MKFDLMRVPAKNSASTAALLNPDIGPQSSPSVRAATIRYACIFGCSPGEAEMQRHFRVTPPSVHQMILNLERAGLIRRTPGAARSIVLLIEPERLPTLLPQPVKSSVQGC